MSFGAPNRQNQPTPNHRLNPDRVYQLPLAPFNTINQKRYNLHSMLQ